MEEYGSSDQNAEEKEELRPGESNRTRRIVKKRVAKKAESLTSSQGEHLLEPKDLLASDANSKTAQSLVSSTPAGFFQNVQPEIDVCKKQGAEIENSKKMKRKVDTVYFLQHELEIIKAKTMFNMVEEVPGLFGEQGQTCKFMFCTNAQARTISSNEDNIERLLQAFEISKCKVVINFLTSPGSLTWVGNLKSRPFTMPSMDPPWSQKEDAQEAERQLFVWMDRIVMPLVCSNSALVLCSGVRGNCYLSDAFLNVLAMRKSKWALSTELPFKVLSYVSSSDTIYANKSEAAHWRKIKAFSKNWQLKDETLKSALAVHNAATNEEDIHDCAQCILMFDCVEESVDNDSGEITFSLSREPGLHVIIAIELYFSKRVPSTAFKTGLSAKALLAERNLSTLGMAATCVEHDTSVILVDLRKERQDVQSVAAKETCHSAAETILRSLNDLDATLRQHGRCECLDVCALAFCHQVLFGKCGNLGGVSGKSFLPIHEAIANAEKERNNPGLYPRMNEIEEVAIKFAEHIFSSLERASQRENKDPLKHRRLEALFANALTLLKSERCFSVNAFDIASSRVVMSRLMRTQRLPSENSLEALHLLRNAWNDHDIAVAGARTYKLLAYIISRLQLLCGFLLVLYSTQQACDLKEEHDIFSYGPLVLSLAATALITMTMYLNPHRRWQQLRSNASVLESIVWQFRTRIGIYASEDAEKMFFRQWEQWREDVLSGSDLNLTTLERHRHHHDRIYKHYQYQGTLSNAQSERAKGSLATIGRSQSSADQSTQDTLQDDFQSPIRPDEYMKLRVVRIMEFYQSRLPGYSLERSFWEVMLLITSLATAFLTRAGDGDWVAVLTFLGAAFRGIQEQRQLATKLARYNSAIKQLKSLQAWWLSLSEIEKGVVDNVTFLVESCETCIATEVATWKATHSRNREDQNHRNEVERSADNG